MVMCICHGPDLSGAQIAPFPCSDLAFGAQPGEEWYF